MKSRAFAHLIVVALLSTFAVSCAGMDAESSAAGTVRVEEGEYATVTSADGTVIVDLPGESFTGSGELSVVPMVSSSEREGWQIELDGATLTGDAQIHFAADEVAPGEPAPLVAYSETAEGELILADGVALDGTVATVTTSHFSNWFVTWWGEQLEEARAGMDRLYSGDAAGQQPRCENEQAVRDGGYTVESDSGNRVMWCLGEDPTGTPELVVANGRGYAVAAESTPGLQLTDDGSGGDLVAMVANLIKEPPSLPQNTVTLVAPGEEVRYAVTGDGQSGVRLQPAASSFLVSAAQYAIDTYVHTFKDVQGLAKSEEQLVQALEAEGCISGYRSMATVDVTTGAEASRYFNDAVGTMLGCLEDSIRTAGLGGPEVKLAQDFSWLVQGARTALNGFGAAADSALNPEGYTITIMAATTDGAFASPSGVVCDVSRPGPAGQDSASCWVPNPAYAASTVSGEGMTCDGTMLFEAPIDSEFNFSCEDGAPQDAPVLAAGQRVVQNNYVCIAGDDVIECVYAYNDEADLVFRIGNESFELYFEGAAGRTVILRL